MGKSASSCFKIITCGADSAEPDDADLSPPESKTSSDKRRWSFRKKSVSHQVPSNTVISEPQFVGYDKTNSEATTNNFNVTKDSFPEKKTVVEQANETAPLSSTVINSEVTGEVETGKTSTAIDDNLQEYIAVTIQAAIRRFLALREFQKLKKVVKLQAAVRGHLVRRQATGTLRCVQAIVKMQALVRARLAHQALEKCGVQRKYENIQIGTQWSTDLPKMNSGLKSDKTNSAVEKLLSNGFARQLLDVKPKAKHIHISCDPLKPDSAWKWLERWMAVTSSNTGKQWELNENEGYQGEEDNSNQTAFEEIDAPPVMASLPTISILPESKSAAAEDEGVSVTISSGKADFQVHASDPNQSVILSTKDENEQSQGEEDLGMKKENIFENENAERTSDPVSSQLQFLSVATLHSEVDNHPCKPVFVTDSLKSTIEMGASEPVEAETKRLETGSKKLWNPSFAAVHAKFEELSSAPKAIRSVGYVCQDGIVEEKPNDCQLDSMANSKEVSPMQNSTQLGAMENSEEVNPTQNSTQLDAIENSKEVNPMQNSTTQKRVVHVAASECGTEISISSTLDSPDESEGDGEEIVLELGALGGRDDVHNGAPDACNLENMEAEAKEPSADSCVFQQGLEESERNNVESLSAFELVEEKEQQKELRTSSIQIQQEKLKDSHNNDRSSPERSPKSHVKVPESDGTPSSQISVSSRTRKAEKKTAAGKPKPKLASKSSPSNLKNDSGERNSMEELPKGAKNAKRRSSFGMAKPENNENEPRLSSSSILPSYMQATESAKAKAHGTLSLNSSPDVHDKDSHIKKRHSLPIVDEKQGSSPRVQRSASQTQQSLKGNSTHSPHTSAERRWQR